MRVEHALLQQDACAHNVALQVEEDRTVRRVQHTRGGSLVHTFIMWHLSLVPITWTSAPVSPTITIVPVPWGTAVNTTGNMSFRKTSCDEAPFDNSTK